MENTVKLSSLHPDTLIGREEREPMKVSDVIYEITELGEPHGDYKWYVTETHYWRPDARWMFENYFENECDNMYEDWDERANDVFGVLIPRIQEMMDAMTDAHKEYVSVFYTCGQEIAIDVFTDGEHALEGAK